jgi:nicotinate-nucleotide adenylyltransferase
VSSSGPASRRIDDRIPRRIGVLGGTFDPPHVGHLAVARDAAEALGLTRVLLVVAARPPHKSALPLSPAEVRLAMVEAAVRGDPLLEASDLELRRAGPSYTVDTLRQLRAAHPGARLFLLLGVDQWRALGGWKEPREIAGLATLAVMAREGQHPGDADPGIGVSYQSVQVRRLDVSSTELRARVRVGRPIRDLVPDPVRNIIEREGLYGEPPALRTVQHA